MRILITGGLGFIGTALKKELESRGHDVEALDIISSPDSIRCDVAEFRQVQDVFESRVDCDLVYHLAAEFGRHNGEAHYETLWKTNVIGTKNIIQMQLKYGFKCVYFSSSEVYGDHPGKMHEEVIPGKLWNDYAMSKWVNEQQALNSRCSSIIVRPFNVYGPGEKYHLHRSVYANFIYRLLRGENIMVYAGHKRGSIFISDFVRTVANIADRNHFNHKAYNVGYNQRHTIERLAEICVKHTKASKKQIKLSTLREPMTVIDKKIDVRRAVADLGHKCEISLDDGIKLTVKWMKEYYGL